ncbi:hypothetical protein PAMA_014301 [Pampus argenteus]
MMAVRKLCCLWVESISVVIPKTAKVYHKRPLSNSLRQPLWVSEVDQPSGVAVHLRIRGGINQGPLRLLRGSKVVFDPVGLLPDDDSKQSGQVQPASTLQTSNLD